MNKLFDLFPKKQNTASPEGKNKVLNIVLAVVLAVILWAYVIGEVNPETETTITGVPLRIVGENVLESNGLALLTEFDSTVTVVVSGRRSDVYNVNASKLSAKIDVSGCVEGENQVSVQISAPDKVSKAEARDGDFLVLVDKVVTEKKNVEIGISGQLSSDTSVEITGLSDEQIDVTGPSTYVDQVSALSGVLTVKDSISDYTRTVDVSPVDEDGNPVEGVELSQTSVTVEAEKVLTKTVSLDVVTVGTAPEGTSVQPTSGVKLRIRGRFDDVKNISSLKTEAVDISNITANTTQDVRVLLPEGVTALTSSGDVIRNQTEEGVILQIDFLVRSAASGSEEPAGQTADNGGTDNGSGSSGGDTASDTGESGGEDGDNSHENNENGDTARE